MVDNVDGAGSVTSQGHLNQGSTKLRGLRFQIICRIETPQSDANPLIPNTCVSALMWKYFISCVCHIRQASAGGLNTIMPLLPFFDVIRYIFLLLMYVKLTIFYYSLPEHSCIYVCLWGLSFCVLPELLTPSWKAWVRTPRCGNCFQVLLFVLNRTSWEYLVENS